MQKYSTTLQAHLSTLLKFKFLQLCPLPKKEELTHKAPHKVKDERVSRSSTFRNMTKFTLRKQSKLPQQLSLVQTIAL
jgi:hypothetical protein